MTSWRRPKWLRNAGVEEIDRILGWEIDWSARIDYLELLTRRVEELAHDEPPIGYRLAVECLAVVAGRAGVSDFEGRALTAAGAAARRMGRFGESARLYGRAQARVTESGSRGRLLLSRAVLAMHKESFDEAVQLAESARHFVSTREDQATALIVLGNIATQVGYRKGSADDMRHALELFSEGVAMAEVGGRAQLSGLASMSAVLNLTSVCYFAHVADTLSALEASFKGRSSRGSKQSRAYVDWIHGKTAYRGGSPKAGRRMLQRAGDRLAGLGLYFDVLRIVVDLIEMETTWGDWQVGVQAGTALVSRIESNEVEPIRHAVMRLIDSEKKNVRQRVEACRNAIKAATGRAA